MKKRPTIILTLCIVLLTFGTYSFLSVEEPPVSETTKARIILSEAEQLKSNKYASQLYQDARMYYDSAMIEWDIENNRFLLFRDYKKSIKNAEKAYELAKEAIAITNSKISSAEELIGIRISLLESKVKNFDTRYSNFPFNIKERNELIKSKLLLKEGILAFKQANYQSSKIQLDSVELLITRLHQIYKERLEDYFSEFPQWQDWVDLSISKSKKRKTYCIIVDKYARECILYKNGYIIQKFEIELGANWIGDKNQQGDKSTPEGLYKIVRKKPNGETKYYKAFLLNYPNDDDKKRFALNKNSGFIKKDAKIGNLIEIHGNGGKGIDWTDGCMALSDTDMDILYDACPKGTSVTIVGSVKPLNKLYLK